LCGVVKAEDDIRLKKMIFRVARGNVLSWSDDPSHKEDSDGKILDPLYDENGKECRKRVFFVAYQLGGTQAIGNRIRRLIDSYNAKTYDIPANMEKFTEKIRELNDQTNGLNTTKRETEEAIKKELLYFQDPDESHQMHLTNFSRIEELKILFFKEREIYMNLDRLLEKDLILHGRFWCSKFQADKVKDILHQMP